MAQPDLEDVIQACSAVFQSQFAGFLAAVDARKSDPLSPNPPQQWVFGDSGNLPQMPAMLFTGHETTEKQDHFEWRVQIYTLMIEAYYTLDNVQNLSRIVRRYGAAIDDTLRANQALGGLPGVRDLSGIKQQYWDSISAKSGLFQVCRVTFDVQVVTD